MALLFFGVGIEIGLLFFIAGALIALNSARGIARSLKIDAASSEQRLLAEHAVQTPLANPSKYSPQNPSISLLCFAYSARLYTPRTPPQIIPPTSRCRTCRRSRRAGRRLRIPR